MSSLTVARPSQTSDSHWYFADGRPCYKLPKTDGSGIKTPTLADARKLGLMPSVTTILRVLDKPALTNWKIEQAVLAVLTSPRKPTESMDAFVERIIHTEAVQDQERIAAAARGNEIHGGLELWFSGRRDRIPEDLLPWIEPAARFIETSGEAVTTEKILCGDDYAGKTDLVLHPLGAWRLWDYKSCKKLPDPKYGAYPEHRLQLSAYGAAWLADLSEDLPGKILVGNVYISTTERGKFAVHETDSWLETYECGFRPLVRYWQWVNNFKPAAAPSALL